MSELGHYGQEIHGLDERIGRLAIALNVDLANDEQVIAFLKNRYERFCGNDPERRTHCEQLRGLLMLKYRVEQSCADYMGDEACRALLAAERERLRRRGFRPSSVP